MRPSQKRSKPSARRRAEHAVLKIAGGTRYQPEGKEEPANRKPSQRITQQCSFILPPRIPAAAPNQETQNSPECSPLRVKIRHAL
ncbi:hypothetical protein FGO68_gene2126 [Halteria grandinella]|uniref:Uncharacterized protein n=1 Tax=Halteria grandinella TaxID=5974 RepID=A0A8J8NX15_HALGN|nr:hypothetical protein FGO68_gene2126 [Halteria grandinella]